MLTEKRRAELEREKSELEKQRTELKKKAREHRDSISVAEIDEITEKMRTLAFKIEDIADELAENEPQNQRSRKILDAQERKITEKNFRESEEYRNAFYRSLATHSIAEGDAEIMAYGRRDITDMNGGSVSSGAAYVTPQTTLDKITTTLEEYGAFYAAVTKYKFTGDVLLPIGVMDAPETKGDGTYLLKFHFEHVKISQAAKVATIEVKNLLLKNSISALESFIAEQLAKYLAIQLDVACLYGDDGSFEGVVPRLTAKKYTKISWEVLCKVMASIKGGYSGRAAWVMNSQTFWADFMSMSTTDGIPVIGTMPIITQTGDQWFILGKPVIMTDAIQAGDFLFGAVNQNYIVDESEDILIESDPSPKFGSDETVFRGKIYSGGAPILPEEAFVYYVKEGDVTATPMATPGAGAVATGTTVELTSATDKAVIYFTLDGSTPTKNSTKYTIKTKPVVNEECTLKAIAAKAGMGDSEIFTAAYTISS